MIETRYLRPSILNRVARDHHAIIEAGAGTGKTHAIAHLMLERLLWTGCTVDQILAVTFTERATGELRARIRRLLEQALAGDTPAGEGLDDLRALGGAARERIETALLDFDRASIYTIHGFCQNLLSELAFDSGVDFQLELVDSRACFHRAFRAELRGHLTVDDSARELLSQWLRQADSGARESLFDSLERLLFEAHSHRYLDSPTWREDRSAIARLIDLFDPRLLQTAYESLQLRPVRERALRAAGQLSELIRMAQGEPQTTRGLLSRFDFGSLPDASRIAGRATADAAMTHLLDAIEVCRRASSLEVRVVESFLPRLAAGLERDKRENRQIEYDDMLTRVWRALAGPRGEALVATLRARLRFALVDEFQDTDDLQWKIFSRIFLDSPERNFLLVVGDPKQAIYGFRGADVFSYLKARDELTRRGVEIVPLATNFRSTASLIDACNLILDQNANPAVFSGPIRYEQPARCGRPGLRARVAGEHFIPPITVFRYSPDGGPAYAARMRAAIGRQIASTIRRILFDQGFRITIHDSDTPPRPVEPDNVFVLTRSLAESDEIGDYLLEQAVPFAFYKRDGLFQTDEAHDILDVLNAILDPDSHSRRLKAWASAFFAVPFEDLPRLNDVPDGHPLIARLFEWRALADRGRLAELFDRLLHDTGLVDRELFLSNSQRRLTNYIHIFEVLLEQSIKQRLSIAAIVSTLSSYIAGTALPPGVNGNVERIESERRAVQVMTVHMSKGLEADVVFLFGGTGRPPFDRSKVDVYHEEWERRLALGAVAKRAANERLDQEQRWENERLTYVALTRARAKLYLPFFPERSTKTAIAGYYAILNNRLNTILASRSETRARLFELEDVADSGDGLSAPPDLSERQASWRPPESLMRDDAELGSEIDFDRLRDRHAALVTRSYIALTRHRSGSDLGAEDFKYDLDECSPAADLPDGGTAGIFLHDVIEKLDPASLAGAIDLESWKRRDDVSCLIAQAMRRRQVLDQRWFDRGAEAVFNALRSPLKAGASTIGPLFSYPGVREMEFVFSIPEPSHPSIASGRDGRWTAERGYLKGLVDFAFEHQGRTYFADFKTDLLEGYDRSAIETHVARHHELQARIYSLAMVRLLQIGSEDDYQHRFGGLLFLFVRGMKPDGNGEQGVYFRKPAWAELARYERSLVDVASSANAVDG